MNVLVASVDALPKVGGVSFMAHHLAASLVRGGAGVVFLGPAGSYVPRDFERNYHFYEDVHSAPHHQQGEDGIAQDARIQRLFETMIRRYSIDRVVLLHSFYYGVGALNACRATGIPCTIFVHGAEIRGLIRRGKQLDLKALARAPLLGGFRERIFASIARADELAVNSRYTGQMLRDIGVSQPVSIVGCGVNIEDIDARLTAFSLDRAGKAALRQALGLPDRPTLTFVGRLTPNKKADRLPALLKYLPDMQALIIGDGPMRPAIAAAAARLGTDRRLIMAGEVSETEKWPLIAASDFVCLLSETDDRNGAVEGFGIALVEGAAAGALLVTSGHGGMGDFVLDGVSGIVFDGGDEALARRIDALWRDQEKADILLVAARNQIVRRFNWNAIAASLLSSWSAAGQGVRELSVPSV